MSGGKGGGTSSAAGTAPAGNTTSTQTSQPWSVQIPYLQNAFQGAQGLYQTPGPQYYPYSTVSPLNQTQGEGLGALTNFGNSGGSSSVNAANGALTNIENGSMLSAGNPYFQNMASSVLSQTVPGLESTFAGGNTMNSPGAAFATSQGANNALGNLAYQNYTQGMNNILQGAYVTPQIQQAQLTPAQALLTAGNQEQSQAQNELNGQINAWNYNQTLPYQQLANYEGAIGGNYGGTSTLTQPYFMNQLANELAGASGGSALGKGLGGALGGQTGSQIGGVAGGLGGLKLSDRRAKKNIEPIFISHNGLPVYRFEYLDDEDEQIGFMADEVEMLHPAAIVKMNGLKMVDYHRAVQ